MLLCHVSPISTCQSMPSANPTQVFNWKSEKSQMVCNWCGTNVMQGLVFFVGECRWCSYLTWGEDSFLHALPLCGNFFLYEKDFGIDVQGS